MISTQANIEEFRRLDGVIEQSEAEAEAARWRQAELAAEAVGRGMRQIDYGRAVGKAQSTISRLVAAWRRWGAHPDTDRPRFTDAFATVDAGADEVISSNEARRRQRERQVPTRHDDRVEMAARLMSDPDVVRSVLDSQTAAASKVRIAISNENAERRQEAHDRNEQRAQDEALPLPAMWASIVTRLDKWSLELAGLYDDLDELPDGYGRDTIKRSATGLARQAQRWVDKLDGQNGQPDLTVIEGDARDVRPIRAMIGDDRA